MMANMDDDEEAEEDGEEEEDADRPPTTVRSAVDWSEFDTHHLKVCQLRIDQKNENIIFNSGP